VLIARIHHLLLSSSFRRSFLLAHLFRSANQSRGFESYLLFPPRRPVTTCPESYVCRNSSWPALRLSGNRRNEAAVRKPRDVTRQRRASRISKARSAPSKAPEKWIRLRGRLNGLGKYLSLRVYNYEAIRPDDLTIRERLPWIVKR